MWPPLAWGGTGELGARHVQLVGEILQAIVRLRDARPTLHGERCIAGIQYDDLDLAPVILVYGARTVRQNDPVP